MQLLSKVNFLGNKHHVELIVSFTRVKVAGVVQYLIFFEKPFVLYLRVIHGWAHHPSLANQHVLT